MRASTTLVLQGILAIVIGFIAVIWPGITVGAFVLLFSVYAFLAAIMHFARAFGGAGSVAGQVLLGIADIAAGVVAIVWPGLTALALVIIVATWAFVTGMAEIVMAFGAGESVGQRALAALTGLVSVALGVVFVIRPDIGAVTIAQVYGFFSLVTGVSQLVIAANLRAPARDRLNAAAV